MFLGSFNFPFFFIIETLKGTFFEYAILYSTFLKGVYS